jgi:phosphatidyl-myo-inositol dimannoside synthase
MAEIVHGLVARGHAVDVVLPHHPDFRYPVTDAIGFFPYRYSPSRRSAQWGFGNTLTGASRVTAKAAAVLPAVVASLHHRVRNLLQAHHYDVVDAHWLVPNGWVAANVVRRHPVPLVITVHGTGVALAERSRVLARLARSALDTANGVTAVSDDLRVRLERLGADSAKLRTVRLGVDPVVFAPERADPGVRAVLGADRTVLVVGVGRLLEVKGFRFAIEAVARVSGVHLTIVGDGPLRSELERLAAQVHAPVTFMGDLERARLPRVLAAADIVVVPSIVTSTAVDGVPNTLLESLATGRPVVASAVGGIPEVVTDGANGLLVPERDVDSLVCALAQLRDQPELRRRLGHTAREQVLRELSWAAAAEQFELAYEAAGSARRSTSMPCDE